MVESLTASFPNLKFDIEHVSKKIIDATYAYVAKKQKTAADIYIEILKQKARFLKKELQIPHHEALEIAAKMVGFKNFKQALQISEKNARYAIEQEKYFKAKSEQIGKNYTQMQYEYYKKSL